MLYSESSRTDFYKQAANNFANSAILGRYTATVHVEGITDIDFWSQIFHHFYPTGKFHFIYYSKSSSGSYASGSLHCLDYKPYLSSRFFVCIDSDNRYLSKESDINIKNLIFQTYTYSIENHYCYAPRLNYVCKKATGLTKSPFNFDSFLLNYSHIIYDLFVWHHYLLRIGNKELDVIPFNDLITFRGKIVNWQIENNGEFMLYKIHQRVKAKIIFLQQKYPDFNLEKEKEIYSNLGVNRDNVYLFIRGHHLMDFMGKIGQICCDNVMRHKNNADRMKVQPFISTLINKLWFDNYICMEKIGSDIINFYNFKNNDNTNEN